MQPDPTSTSLTVVGFMSTVASLILSIVAIWLSIIFFKMSSTLSTTTTEAAKGIGASVERLEKLFDKLYADTFSMMKDTVTDMRAHIWPKEKSDAMEEVERRAEEKLNLLKETLGQEITRVIEKQSSTEVGLASLKKEIGRIVAKGIEGSRKVEKEALEETVRDRIRSVYKDLRMRGKDVTWGSFSHAFRDEIDIVEVANELRTMRTQGLVTWDGPLNVLNSHNEILLTDDSDIK